MTERKRQNEEGRQRYQKYKNECKILKIFYAARHDNQSNKQNHNNMIKM